MNRMELKFSAKSVNERLARTVCAAFLLELDPTVDEMSEVKTAISEAVTNSIIHAYNGESGVVEIKAEIEGDTVTYTVRDFGCGIDDIAKAREPLYTGKPDSERSGMGFAIMEAFMDKLEVESVKGEGTAVRMIKRITRDEQ